MHGAGDPNTRCPYDEAGSHSRTNKSQEAEKRARVNSICRADWNQHDEQDKQTFRPVSDEIKHNDCSGGLRTANGLSVVNVSTKPVAVTEDSAVSTPQGVDAISIPHLDE